MVGKYLQRQNNRKYSSDTESFVFDVDAQINRKQNSGNNVSSFITFFPFCSTEVNIHLYALDSTLEGKKLSKIVGCDLPCVTKVAIVCDSFSRKPISVVYCLSLLYVANDSQRSLWFSLVVTQRTRDYSRGNRSVPKTFDQFICSSLTVPLINSSKF